MGTVFASNYANLSMGYQKIKRCVLIESNYNLKITQYFVENWKKFLDDCEIRLKANLIKPDDLLTSFCCNYIVKVEFFKFTNWHQPFILKSYLNCETP